MRVIQTFDAICAFGTPSMRFADRRLHMGGLARGAGIHIFR
jgi:hypothetical protein